MWENILSEILGPHRGKVIGVILGLIASVLFISFGFWKTLFIAICITIGYFVGKKIDEQTDFEAWLKQMFKQK